MKLDKALTNHEKHMLNTGEASVLRTKFNKNFTPSMEHMVLVDAIIDQVKASDWKYKDNILRAIADRTGIAQEEKSITVFHGTKYELPKGAVLVGTKPIKSSEHLTSILCRWDRPHQQEFVTWIYNHETGGCVSGHYFNDLEAAVIDFNDRG